MGNKTALSGAAPAPPSDVELFADLQRAILTYWQRGQVSADDVDAMFAILGRLPAPAPLPPPQEPQLLFPCPVCAYQMRHPAKDHICAQCGTEFGNDDTHTSHEELREKWIAGGCKFWYTGKLSERPAALAGETQTEPELKFLTSSMDKVHGNPYFAYGDGTRYDIRILRKGDGYWSEPNELDLKRLTELAAAASRIAEKDIDQFQLRMTAWGIRCFGQDHMDDPVIRGMRLLEEAIEFAQAVGVTQITASALISYVYGREAGNPEQELGGVAVTLMACASALKRKLSEIIMAEIIRVESKGEKHFTERNQIKRDLGFK